MYQCQLHINGQILLGWDVGEENGMIVFFEEVSWKKYLVSDVGDLVYGGIVNEASDIIFS